MSRSGFQVKSRLSARLMPNQNIRLVPQEQWDQPLHRKVLMKSIFLVLAMMACAGELRAQTHINQLQGIIQSGMQPSSVPGPGTGVAVGPTSHIAQLQGIIQNGMQPYSVQPGTGLGYGTTSASYTRNTIRQVQTALRQLGYYHGQIDGQFGSLSQTALQNYQFKTSQPATGLLDRQSLSQLGVQAK